MDYNSFCIYIEGDSGLIIDCRLDQAACITEYNVSPLPTHDGTGQEKVEA